MEEKVVGGRQSETAHAVAGIREEGGGESTGVCRRAPTGGIAAPRKGD